MSIRKIIQFVQMTSLTVFSAGAMCVGCLAESDASSAYATIAGWLWGLSGAAFIITLFLSRWSSP